VHDPGIYETSVLSNQLLNSGISSEAAASLYAFDAGWLGFVIVQGDVIVWRVSNGDLGWPGAVFPTC
jgi:hypothetical protein